jgi:hypothetical protein
MKFALMLVAFSHTERSQGIVALLETALDALDEDQEHFVAACVSAALDHYCAKIARNGGAPPAASGVLQ